MEIKEYTYFYPEKPFLITKEHKYFKKFSQEANWICEKKYNGTRLQLHYINNKFLFLGRHNNILSFKPSDELLETLNKLNLKGYCLFDGELRHNKIKGIRNKIIFYDVFIYNNKLLINTPFSERRKILESFLEVENEPIGLTKQFKNNFLEIFNNVIQEDEIEGIVLKNINGILNLSPKSAKQSSWMFKVRRPSKNYKF